LGLLIQLPAGKAVYLSLKSKNFPRFRKSDSLYYRKFHHLSGQNK
jgi:hypothetical protein